MTLIIGNKIQTTEYTEGPFIKKGFIKSFRVLGIFLCALCG